MPRTIFWRYKANAQRAIRDGDFKFLKILDNTFLFNVVDDPMERVWHVPEKILGKTLFVVPTLSPPHHWHSGT